MILVNSEIAHKMASDGTLQVLRKEQQKGSLNYNYFIKPALGIKLYNPKVFISTQTYVVFQFDRHHNLPLLLMCRSIDKTIQHVIHRNFNTHIPEANRHSFFSEQQDTFTIRCNVPKTKAGVHCEWEGGIIPFKYPRVGTTYEEATIQLKNVWESSGRLGYNVELCSLKN